MAPIREELRQVGRWNTANGPTGACAALDSLGRSDWVAAYGVARQIRACLDAALAGAAPPEDTLDGAANRRP
jgi:hypothetical protein